MSNGIRIRVKGKVQGWGFALTFGNWRIGISYTVMSAMTAQAC